VQIAAIPYRNGKLEASEHDDLWTVRLANLEERASYLDLALAKLLDNAPEAHRAAARLLVELADVVEQQDAAHSHATAVRRPQRRPAPRRQVWQKPLILSLRVLAFAALASTAFILTTWLSTLR
jgi:hypothetical protein